MMKSLSDTIAPPAAAFGSFRLIRLFRRDGPFELWAADDLDPARRGGPLVLRRALLELSQKKSVRETLERASQIARRVSHPNVVLCHGTREIDGAVVQIAEHVHDLDLEALIRAARAFDTPLEITLSVWIARQMLEAIVHASSLGFVHGNLTPQHVYWTREGAVKVDFGIARVEGDDAPTAIAGAAAQPYELPKTGTRGQKVARSPDTYAVACILWELLAGEQYAHAAQHAGGYVPITQRRAGVPAPIEAALKRALDLDSTESPDEAKSLNAQLARAFYVDLDADDTKHGQRQLVRWAARLLPDISGSLEPDPPDREQRKGAFTRMLEERERPVEPQPLTPDDRDSNVLTNAPWLEPSISERKTEAMPVGSPPAAPAPPSPPPAGTPRVVAASPTPPASASSAGSPRVVPASPAPPASASSAGSPRVVPASPAPSPGPRVLPEPPGARPPPLAPLLADLAAQSPRPASASGPSSPSAPPPSPSTSNPSASVRVRQADLDVLVWFVAGFAVAVLCALMYSLGLTRPSATTTRPSAAAVVPTPDSGRTVADP